MTVRPLLILAWCAIALLVLAATLVAAMLVLTPNLEITNWRMMLNAMTGAQEKILILLEDESGTLAL